jgi:RNA polymerase sigma-70 factor (ECF subfamily)
MGSYIQALLGVQSGPIAAPTGALRTDVDAQSAHVTLLLKQLSNGNEEAAARLIPLVYDELHRVAQCHLQAERPDHTLQPTALVHEAYLKLITQHSANWQSRAHFFAVASRIMRRILVDHARGRLRAKRGGKQARVPLDKVFILSRGRCDELLALDESLERLSKLDERQSRIVELRFFGGLNVDEVAKVLGVSPKTVKRDWSMAKAWLYGELRDRHGHDAGEVGENQGAV